MNKREAFKQKFPCFSCRRKINNVIHKLVDEEVQIQSEGDLTTPEVTVEWFSLA